jgi:hypothetical protein
VLYTFETEPELLDWLQRNGFRLAVEPNDELVGAHLLRLLADETDPLSLVLRAHLYLENLLEVILRKKFPRAELLLKNRDFTFSMKVDLLRAKNYLDAPVYQDIKRVNAIRNKFAHELRFDFVGIDFSQFTYCEYLADLKLTDPSVRVAVNVYMFKNIVFWLLAQLTKRHPYLGEARVPA